MLNKIKTEWKERVSCALEEMLGEGIPELSIGQPPKAEMGDIAFPMFQYAKLAHKAPAAIAADVMAKLGEEGHPEGEMLVAGPYLNVKLDIAALFAPLSERVKAEGDAYGRSHIYDGKKVMLEFSCPNTNKPLHLGHMRNDSLGQSCAEILKANGAEVMKVNLINNRGVHICKSMLAYKTFGGGETPETTGEKGDHFVGRYYVRFATWAKEADKEIEELEAAGKTAEAEEKRKNHPDVIAQSMLKKWEDGDEEVRALWQKMNDWTLEGLAESYKNMGISFDKYYYESQTYKFGKDEVLKGLEDGVFYREKDGSVQIDLTDIGLDKKVVLRKDGTTIYITQDIGTAIRRHDDYPFDSLVYTVASEQTYHFKVLFEILRRLGYSWAKELHHLSYGMVNLPNGRMKSREGTVVDADDLLAELSKLAKNEIIAKEREDAVGDVDETSRKIALAALNYYLLQVSPAKDMVFDPEKSISFNGNTGPYLEYMGARISSIMRKANADTALMAAPVDGSLLTLEDEKALIKLVAGFQNVVEEAGRNYDPSQITAFLYDVAKTFSHYYHDNQILKAETVTLSRTRVALVEMILQTMKNAFALVGVPFLESM